MDEFHQILYQSIALEELYHKSFESESIGWNGEPQNPENRRDRKVAPSHRVRFLRFAAERFTGSSLTYNQLCRALQELSNGYIKIFKWGTCIWEFHRQSCRSSPPETWKRPGTTERTSKANICPPFPLKQNHFQHFGLFKVRESHRGDLMGTSPPGGTYANKIAQNSLKK